MGFFRESLSPISYGLGLPFVQWVLEGLLKSELYDYAWDLLQNFMDLIDVSSFACISEESVANNVHRSMDSSPTAGGSTT